MKLSEINQYISGKDFSNGLRIDCQTNREIIDRIDFLVNITKKKKVLHIGFTDHLPLIENKISQNRWLHKRLYDSCSKCVGLDINQEAVNYVKHHLGIHDVYCHDAVNQKPLEEVKRTKYDFIILGEVLEHIDNPVQFLEKIKTNYCGLAKKIIVTVPNALNYNNFRFIRKHIECINTDHRYWFTPFTLAKVVYQSDLKTVEQGFCDPPVHRFGLVSRFLRRYPLISHTLFLIADLNE